MSTTIAQVSALLEKNILPTIQDQLFGETVLLNKIKKNPKGLRFNNDTIYITATSSGHSGVAFTGGTGAIATGKPTSQQMSTSARFGYGSHTFYDSTLQAVNGDKGSIIDIVSYFGQELQKEFGKSLNRQLFGNGEGVLTTVSSGAASTATHSVASTRFLRVGQAVLVGTKAEVEAGTADSVTVSSINSSTSVTFASSITTVTGDRIVTVGVYSGGAYNELAGLGSLVSNNVESSGSSLQGISRATNDWVNSYVDSTSATLTEAQIMDAVTAAAEVGNPDLIVTTPTLRNKYAALLSGQRRYNTMDLGGGFVGLEVAVADRPIAMVGDYDCTDKAVYVLDTSSLGIAELAPIDFLRSGSGGIMSDVFDTNGARVPAFQVAMRFYGNLVTTKPKANAKLTTKTA